VTNSEESVAVPIRDGIVAVRERIAVVRDRIAVACQKSERKAEEIRLIAVTKKVAVERIREAAADGLQDFGESYVQEARAKIDGFEKGPTWHFIGHLQINKVKYVPTLFDYVHSIDRWDLLEQLDSYQKPLSVLFEVNLSGEPQKHGATEEGLGTMLEKIRALKHVRPMGLMTVPPWSEDPEDSRPFFAALRGLLEQVNSAYDLTMRELSMGMSSDFEVAIEEGATMVRVGTAIFGERL
jgi:PLP dependent protein